MPANDSGLRDISAIFLSPQNTDLILGLLELWLFQAQQRVKPHSVSQKKNTVN